MNNIFSKIKFLLKKPKVVIISGSGQEVSCFAVKHVLKNSSEKVLVVEFDSKRIKDFEFLVKYSSQVVLLATHVGQYHPDKEFFGAEQEQVKNIADLASKLPSHAYLVLNFDDETVRDIKTMSSAHVLTFGFGARADLRASDLVLNQLPESGTNFKLNWQGKIVPVWLDSLFGKENIYAALSVVGTASVLGLNLVEISESLGSWPGVQGHLKLIKGIKNSWILDDSDSAHPLSMVEGLSLLKKIETKGRRIAVLGDILGVGKYTIESHEAIGEQVQGAADLLFAVGQRAKFYIQGAERKGMAEKNILHFNDVKTAGLALQKEIRENDLILIDGAREMKMGEIVQEIKSLD